MRSPDSRETLGVFAKYWTPGTVKTRLAATIGPDAASELYREFVMRTLARFASLAVDRVLAFSPCEQRSAFELLAPASWRLVPQEGNDLGDRIRNFFANATAGAARRIVLIGTDSPTLPTKYVIQAFHALKTKPVVLGPATDGGYYLVGVAGMAPPMFDGISWSTSEVWQQTTTRLKQLQLPFAVLPEWYDVDEEADLRRLHRELGPLAVQDAAWRPLSRLVQSAIGAFPS